MLGRVHDVAEGVTGFPEDAAKKSALHLLQTQVDRYSDHLCDKKRLLLVCATHFLKTDSSFVPVRSGPALRFRSPWARGR